MRRLFPLVIFLVEWHVWCRALAPLPLSFRKLLDLEVRYERYSERSWESEHPRHRHVRLREPRRLVSTEALLRGDDVTEAVGWDVSSHSLEAAHVHIKVYL